jgi:quercetin dioxygenase-like cupin family protein
MSIRKTEDQVIIHAAGDIYRFLATSEETDGAYALWHATVPPGGGPPLHVHNNEDERFDLLAGKLRFQLGDEFIDAMQGDSLTALRGVPHAFINQSDEPAEMLIHVTPGGMEKMFLEFGNVVDSIDAVPTPMTEQEINKIKQVAPDYGIEVLGPSLGVKL